MHYSKIDSSIFIKLNIILCLSAVLTSLFAQHYFGLMICSWCIIQRTIYLLISIISIIFLKIINRKSIYLYIFYILIFLLIFIEIITIYIQYSYLYDNSSLNCKNNIAESIINFTRIDYFLPWFFGIYTECISLNYSIDNKYSFYWCCISMIVSLNCLILNLMSINISNHRREKNKFNH